MQLGQRMPLLVALISIIFLTHSFAGAETAPVNLDDIFQSMESFVPASAAKSNVGSSSAPAGASQLDFSLPVFGSNEWVALNDFKGEIVVLDFFAHWCEPCRKASPQIEAGIALHYAGLGGNRHDIPVRVLGINVDDSVPEATARFVEETGLERVLDDHDGKVLEQYGGSGLPFIVVVDMSGATPRIAYESTGFKGVEALRTAIDAISGSTAADCSSCVSPEVIGGGTYDISLASAILDAPDVQLVDSIIEYNERFPGRKLTFTLLHGYIGMDFEPTTHAPPATLEVTHLESHKLGLNISARFDVSDSLAWTIGGGANEGFSDYRSLWLDEYYRQVDESLQEFFGVARNANYREPDPWGANVSTDLRWEYLPTCGFLTGSLNYSYATGLASYEENPCNFPHELKAGNDTFHTIGGGLALENILTRRLRSSQDLQLSQTTSRELRIALKSSFNYAIADSWVCRTEFSYTHEDPDFDGWSAGAVLEKDWNNTWFLSVAGRYYEDTGEYVQTTIANSTAPSVRTYQGVLGLRWQGRSNSLKLSAGPYFNYYLEEPYDPNFSPLYQDRDWIYVNLAYTHVF